MQPKEKKKDLDIQMIFPGSQMTEATTKKYDQSIEFWHQINERDATMTQASTKIMHIK